MNTKKEIISNYRESYLKADKKEKTDIINVVSRTTGLSRDRTIRLLNYSGYCRPKNSKRGPKIFYTPDILYALEEIWTILYYPCGKRLAPAINAFIDALERHGQLKYDPVIVSKLRKLSSATIDRLLAKIKQNNPKGKSATKPGSLLKKDIPIRLGNDWDEDSPGFVEIDLVAHCGDTTAGDYINTLDVTDIYTGWTETRACLNKAQKHVFDALIFIKEQLPFNLRGIDSDNGGEFINNHLFNYCILNNICFTRSRPYKKNDNAHVEQKNWAVVRKHMGYHRYEGRECLSLINQYYQCLRLFTNFFLPQTKLIDKARYGSKVKKVYENYQTPYQRILNSDKIPKKNKDNLTKIFYSLDPIKLKKEMELIQDKLIELALPWGTTFYNQKKKVATERILV